MGRPIMYSPEVRERAVRLVLEHRDEHRSEWAAICSIAEKCGCSSETLRKWVRRAEADQGLRPGSAVEESVGFRVRVVKYGVVFVLGCWYGCCQPDGAFGSERTGVADSVSFSPKGTALGFEHASPGKVDPFDAGAFQIVGDLYERALADEFVGALERVDHDPRRCGGTLVSELTIPCSGVAGLHGPEGPCARRFSERSRPQPAQRLPQVSCHCGPGFSSTLGWACGGHVHRRQSKPFGQRIADSSDSRKNLIHDVQVAPAGCGPPGMLSGIERGRDLDEGVNHGTVVNRQGAFDDPDLIADVPQHRRSTVEG